MPLTKAPPSPSIVNAPATSSGSPVRDVGLDLLVGDAARSAPGSPPSGRARPPGGCRSRSGRCAARRRVRASRCQRRSPRPPSPGLPRIRPSSVEHGVAADHQGPLSGRAATATALSWASFSAYRPARSRDAVLVDAADDHDLGLEPGAPQGLQPGGRRGGEDQPGSGRIRSSGSPLRAPGAGRRAGASVRTSRRGRRPRRASVAAGRGCLGRGGRQRGDDRDQRRDLLGGRVALDDAQQRGLAGSTIGSSTGSTAGSWSSQRDVPVLLGRQRLALGAQQPQRPDDLDPGLVRAGSPRRRSRARRRCRGWRGCPRTR